MPRGALLRRPLGQLDQAGQEPGQGLAAAGGRDQQRVAPGARLLDHRQLVRPRRPAAPLEPRGEPRRQGGEGAAVVHASGYSMFPFCFEAQCAYLPPSSGVAMKLSTTIRRRGGNTAGILIPDARSRRWARGKRRRCGRRSRPYLADQHCAEDGAFSPASGAEVRAKAGVGRRRRRGAGAGRRRRAARSRGSTPTARRRPRRPSRAEQAKFEKLSCARSRQHVMAIDGGQAPATRARRIEGVLTILRGDKARRRRGRDQANVAAAALAGSSKRL